MNIFAVFNGAWWLMLGLLKDCVTRGIAPGGVLVYGDQGRDIETIAFGRTQTHPIENAVDVTPETIYDIASLTKPVATVAVLMRLVEVGSVDLEEPVRSLLPELRTQGSHAITVRHLVGHASGLPAHIEFYKRLLRGDRQDAASAREGLLRMAATTDLVYCPGAQTVYSDLGYILLGFCLERSTGERLDQLTRRLVTGPLCMRATCFVDLDAEPPAPRPRPVAPTEVCPRRRLVVGEVHDDNSHAAGGVLGHAGLFSTASDLSRFARSLISAMAGAHKWLSPEVVRHFLFASAAPNTNWRLGWDTPSHMSQAGDLWPRDGVGHLGFTGCSLWLDPPHGRYVVLLTNRVHPSRDSTGIREFRRAVMDAVVRRLTSSKSR